MAAYEELAVEAAVRGGRGRVLAALLAHPLVGQYDLAGKLADRLIAENLAYLPWADAGGHPVSGAVPAVLAIDGGNSKSDLALVAGDGTLLASVRGPGMASSPSLEENARGARHLIGQAQRRAGRHGIPRRPPPFRLPGQRRPARRGSGNGRCAARAGLERDHESGQRHLRGVAGRARTPAAAGVPRGRRPAERHWGVAVTCGAGINCVGVAPDGQKTGFLALGGITGDWGGGHGLGMAALWWAIRAEDGRGPDTELRGGVAGHFGVPSVDDVAIGIHLGTIAEPSLGELAPVVLALGNGGDAVAAGLVRRQAEEICAMALTVMRRLVPYRAGDPRRARWRRAGRP